MITCTSLQLTCVHSQRLCTLPITINQPLQNRILCLCRTQLVLCNALCVAPDGICCMLHLFLHLFILSPDAHATGGVHPACALCNILLNNLSALYEAHNASCSGMTQLELLAIQIAVVQVMRRHLHVLFSMSDVSSEYFRHCVSTSALPFASDFSNF